MEAQSAHTATPITTAKSQRATTSAISSTTTLTTPTGSAAHTAISTTIDNTTPNTTAKNYPSQNKNFDHRQKLRVRLKIHRQ